MRKHMSGRTTSVALTATLLLSLCLSSSLAVRVEASSSSNRGYLRPSSSSSSFSSFFGRSAVPRGMMYENTEPPAPIPASEAGEVVEMKESWANTMPPAPEPINVDEEEEGEEGQGKMFEDVQPPAPEPQPDTPTEREEGLEGEGEGKMFEDVQPPAPEPQPTTPTKQKVGKKRDGGKMFEDVQPPAPEPQPTTPTKQKKGEGKMFEDVQPPAPEPQPTTPTKQKVAKMFEDVQPPAPEPQPTTPTKQKKREEEKMFEDVQPPAPEPQPVAPSNKKKGEEEKMFEDMQPPAPEPQPVAPSNKKKGKMYEDVQPPAPQPEPTTPTAKQAKEKEEEEEDEEAMMIKKRIEAQYLMRHNSSPSETFEWRFYDEEGEEGGVDDIPRDAEIDVEEDGEEEGVIVPLRPKEGDGEGEEDGINDIPLHKQAAEEEEDEGFDIPRHKLQQQEGRAHASGISSAPHHSYYPTAIDQEEGDSPFFPFPSTTTTTTTDTHTPTHPQPHIRTLDATTPFCSPTSFTWTSEQGELRVNGLPFHLKGTNWFGFETEQRIPFGLDVNSMDFYFQFLKNQRFNALRIPISVDFALDPDGLVPAQVVDAPLITQNNFQRLNTLVERAGDFGLLVMLDMHRLSPSEEITPLWYDDTHEFDGYLQAWDNVMAIFGGKWNVFAVDMKNEPHGVATWGTGDKSTDWNSAAEAIAKHIAEKHTQFTGLFFVEGIDNPTTTGNKAPIDTHSKPWGGDLEGVRAKPINLGKADLNKRVVYSPHVYGPSVFDREYFAPKAGFPANLPGIWTTQWAFAEKQTQNAVVLGEWGGKYEKDSLEGRDVVWQDSLGDFLVQNCLEDTFYWTLNPNSGDTYGLLLDDWQTPNADKLALLARVQPDPSIFAKAGENVCFLSGNYANPSCAH